jgi:hypothetical protein
MAINLSNIGNTKHAAPPRIVVYGTHGIGKSCFAASAPNPIFIQTEDGLAGISTNAFPLASTTADIMDAINSLATEKHDFQTVVLDSADWAENIMAKEIETKFDSKDLAYGRSAVLLADAWRNVLQGLNYLRDEKGMTVILLAHSEIKRFDSPVTDSFDRYIPKGQAKSIALIQEWADVIGFANFKTIVKSTDVGFGNTKTRGLSNGERFLFLQETPAFVAKNRYNLPTELPFSWESLSTAMAQQ